MWTYQFIAIGMLLAAVLFMVSASRLLPHRPHNQLRFLAVLLTVFAVGVSIFGVALTFASEGHSVTESVLVTVFAAFFIASAIVLGIGLGR